MTDNETVTSSTEYFLKLHRLAVEERRMTNGRKSETTRLL